MSADVAARLRVLARDHHEGRLTLAVYRQLRAPLLDSLSVRAASSVDDEAVTRPRLVIPRTAAANGVSVDAPVRTSKAALRMAVIALGLLLLAGAVWWALHSRNGGGGAAGAANGAAGTSALQSAIREFSERADWNDSRVAALNATLLELDRRRIAAAASEQWFQDFVDTVRRRFKEQQALAAAALTPDNSPLAALAVTVGLDLNSPDAAIVITPAEPPPVPAERPATVAPPARPHEKPVHAAPQAAAIGGGESDVKRRVATNAVVPPVAAGAAEPTQPAAATRATTCRLDLVGSRRPLCHDELSSGGNGPELALVPAGSFDMGSTVAATEEPVHRVNIAQPFGISVYEVSQGEFMVFCERTGRDCAAQPWSGDDYPAVNVSWNDARSYVEWLSGVTRARYRLPTEAEWEYAARAGQSGLFPSGDALSPTDAWFSINGTATAPARRSQKFNHNAFRLVHTVGNVREWVEDGWTRNFAGAPGDGTARSSPAGAGLRVARGGSYVDSAAKLRLSVREALPEGTRDSLTGFRIVRELP